MSMVQDKGLNEGGEHFDTPERLGEILVRIGALSPADVDKIVELQQNSGLPFGQIAIDKNFASQRDVQVALARQFNYVQMLSGDSPNVSSELVLALKPFEKDAETFRFLRGRLMTSLLDKDERTIAITGSENKVGASYVAANLAISMAQLGRRTLLIDTNLRRPRVKRLFGIENSFGLSEVLVGRASASSVIMSNMLENLSILCSGNVPPNPQELLGGRAFKELFEELASIYDVIVADTPGGAHIADASFVWSHCKNVVMVVRQDDSGYDTVAGVADMIDECGANLVGCVLNDF